MPVSHSPSHWTRSQIATLVCDAQHEIPVITKSDVAPALPGIDLWDLWPVQLIDGSTAKFDGWALWHVLSAPALPDPEERHHLARIRLVMQRGNEYRDCGDLMPDGHSPGSREWAGSALYDPATNKMTLFFTASGRRGEAQRTFEQRLFQTSGQLSFTDGIARVENWTVPVESVAADCVHYMRVGGTEGVPGFIKGFRDPAHFRDPLDGQDYLLFTGSLKQSTNDWNGAIGIIRGDGADHDRWTLLPPLITADGLNNELERPIMIHRDGLYYLFWSTQRKVFAPDGPNGPTGIYGMVASSVLGPYAPLNGSGLVAACPAAEPFQCYSWWVDNDLNVWGFIDLWGLNGQPIKDDPAFRRAHFGGTPAPVFRLVLDGASAWVQEK